MKEEEYTIFAPEQIIPEKTIKYKKYIAEDGKEFSNKNKCLEYEREIAFKKLITNFDYEMELDEKYTNLSNVCYISNKKEAEIVFDYCEDVFYKSDTIKSVDDFFVGENLYIIIYESRDIGCRGCVDYTEYYEIITFDEYSKIFTDYLNAIKNSVIDKHNII